MAVRDLQHRADRYWEALPSTFRMEGSLKDYQTGPWQRDFLVSTRLNYLHIHFLLHLLSMGSTTDPSAEFVELSCEILARVTEVITSRHQLACSSGTSFEWKVSTMHLCSCVFSGTDFEQVGALRSPGDRYYPDCNVTTTSKRRYNPGL